MTTAESALLAALDHYTTLLATPHSDIRAWRRRVVRAKTAVALLAEMAEVGAWARLRVLH